LLRNGERKVDAQLMDVILPVVDVVNTQFDEIRAGTEPTTADPSLMNQLEALLNPSIESSVEESAVPGEESEDSLDAEFEAIIDAAQASKSSPKSNTDEITGDEFEALLDQLHGSGAPNSDAADTAGSSSAPPPGKDGEITDDEFEALLDQLHGGGTPSGMPGETPEPASEPASVKTPEKKVTAKEPKAPVPTEKAPAPVSAAKEPPQQQAETTVRVDTKRLDDIMNMVGELVLVRNRVANLGLAERDDEMAKVVSSLDVVTADLQSAVMKTRMQPIKKVFGRFPRVVRDLARNLKKEVNLELQGEETDLDKNLVEALADPLVHLVRNAVDHGIEMPAQREASGKPRAGTVVLTAEQEGDHILLMIQDDGKGMNPDNLRHAAVEKGMMDQETADRLEDKDCYNLIFAPGFSTKVEISDVSGRGVGMDVVKTRIGQLNGTVEIDSKEGYGSTIRIQVPLTLAIMPTLMVKLEDQIFALPLASVNEIFHLDLTNTNVIDGQLVVMVRNKALPLFYLRRWLVSGADYVDLPDQGHVVVVSIGAQRVGFVVDQLIGQEEVVIKPLGALLHGMKGLAGATITGDGRISLILDIPGLMQTYARKI